MSGSTQWITISSCPNCEDKRWEPKGQLAIPRYQFGSMWIDLPPGGIAFAECKNCGLIFKRTIPTLEFVSKLMSAQSDQVWNDPYPHDDDTQLAHNLMGHGDFDLLDIGASNGFLLQALNRVTSGRLSALDVIEYPSLKARLRGEFIRGTIEDPQLHWEGRPYDLVTAYDVFEHLYRPGAALENLKKLIKPSGFAILETGDTDSAWPNRYGIGHWWYSNWFVHHIFWSERSLRYAAQAHGLEIVKLKRKKHKSRMGMPLKSFLKECLKVSLYRASRQVYRKFAISRQASGIQPYSPFTRDHLQVVLKIRSQP